MLVVQEEMLLMVSMEELEDIMVEEKAGMKQIIVPLEVMSLVLEVAGRRI